MPKVWNAHHLELARAAAEARDQLRGIEWAKIDQHNQRVIAKCIWRLSAALKFRRYQDRKERDAA